MVAQLVEHENACLVTKDALSATTLLLQTLSPRQEYSLENIKGSNPYAMVEGVLNLSFNEGETFYEK